MDFSDYYLTILPAKEKTVVANNEYICLFCGSTDDDQPGVCCGMERQSRLEINDTYCVSSL